MASLFPRILYFIAGMTPTDADLEAADKYGPGVKFRNATLVAPEGGIEEADGIAGDPEVIPTKYSDALPHADDGEAVKARVLRRNPNLANMGGNPLPPKTESEDAKAARIANDLSRGAKPEPRNERHRNDPSLPSGRVTQSGHPSVVTGEQMQSDGWNTDTNALHDDDETDGDGSDEGTDGDTKNDGKQDGGTTGNDGFTTGRAGTVGTQSATGAQGQAKPLTAAQRKAAERKAKSGK